MTKVSVLTPSYQYGRFLGDCLRSVENQQGVEVEHIVADGGSTDETVSVLSRSTADWISEPDKGQSDALNKALSRASGEWIAWLNADEFYLPGALAKLVAAASADTGIVFGESAHVDADGRFIRRVAQHRMDDFVLNHYGCFIPTCAVIIRRHLLDMEAWDSELRVVMDWDLFLGLARRARFTFLPAAVAGFRVHDAQVTAQGPSFTSSIEHNKVRARHGIAVDVDQIVRMRAVAKVRHGALKAANGGYFRELAGRRRRGGSMTKWLAVE